MLGAFRLVLALMVVVYHLTGGARGVEHLGPYAVIGFYVLSGFLITSVLRETYRFDGARFWTNRFLRLMPTYYGVALIGLAALLLFPAIAANYHPIWRADADAWDWINQALLLPLAFDREFRLVPPAWSVAVEIVNYAILWAVTARSLRWALTLFALGACYHAYGVFSGWTWELYFPPYAAVLPFSAGALCHFALRSGWSIRLALAPLVLAVWGGILVYVGSGGAYFGAAYYLNMLAVAAIILALAQQRSTSFTAADKALGDLAYPVFLVHWFVGLGIYALVPDFGTRGWAHLAVALPFVLLAGSALAWFARAVIEPVRDRVRRSAVAAPDTLPPAAAAGRL